MSKPNRDDVVNTLLQILDVESQISTLNKNLHNLRHHLGAQVESYIGVQASEDDPVRVWLAGWMVTVDYRYAGPCATLSPLQGVE